MDFPTTAGNIEFYGIAADFAVLHICLLGHGSIYKD
jgi:hypothetical protein